jgi:hypothetical protein
MSRPPSVTLAQDGAAMFAVRATRLSLETPGNAMPAWWRMVLWPPSQPTR